MCDSTIPKANELMEDPEAQAIANAILFMDGAEDRAKERFVYHLVHRYFPKGVFEPKRVFIKTANLTKME